MNFTQLDYHLFQTINGLGQTLSVLNPLMKMLASYAEYLFYIGVVVYWLTRNSRNRRMVAEALLSACIALLASNLIGRFFYRDRPFVTHVVLQLIDHPANASFPSDHAIGAFVIATSIWIYRRKAGIVWLVLAAGIALSRVWTGVHYPSDVVGGAVIGIAVATLVHQLFKRSALASNVLKQLMAWYEAVEAKLWPRKETGANVVKG